MKRTIVVGTRQSELALAQTNEVIARLRQALRECSREAEFRIEKIVTRGDRILDRTLSKIGGKGLFVKEIEKAMLAGEIDIAVHSLKDMPSHVPDGLTIGAVCRREEARDCLVGVKPVLLDGLPRGARIGTSSLRRSAQLKAYRQDLEIVPIRGNIHTRLRKLEEEGLDAIVLAAAGLMRVGLEKRIGQILPAEICVPAVGQGAICVECREEDGEIRNLLRLVHDEETAFAVEAERRFMAWLDGGCQVPFAAHAVQASPGHLRMTAMVALPDGSRLLKESMEGTDPLQLGEALAERLAALGANDILREARAWS